MALSPGPSGTYMTPQRFRSLRSTAGDLNDLELAEILWGATAIVNSYCNVPTRPQPHSFLGGTATDEMHRWRLPEVPWDHHASVRVTPYHWPVIEVSAFEIILAAGVTAEINTDSLVLNNEQRWIETTALSIATTSYALGSAIYPIMGLREAQVQISYTYGWAFSETSEILTRLPDSDTVFQSGHPYWIDNANIEIEIDGSPASPDVDLIEGRVTFAAPVASSAVVTATYDHRLPGEITRAAGLIADYEIGMSNLNRRGMAGLERLTVGEITAVRPFHRGITTESAVTTGVPAADLLLAGYRFWRVA